MLYQKISVIFLVSIVIFSKNYSAHSQSVPDSIKTPSRIGIWSLQFEIDNNFTLKDFQGMTISTKWHHMEKQAIRFGVSLSGNYGNRDRNYIHEPGLRVKDEYDNRSDVNLLTFDLLTQYLWYTSPLQRIYLFYGCGPMIGYQTSSIQSETGLFTNDTLLSNYVEDKSAKMWRAGVNLVVGVEWFVTQSISLLAEYCTLFYYSYDKTYKEIKYKPENRITEREQIKSDGFFFNPSEVKFGVSIYFK